MISGNSRFAAEGIVIIEIEAVEPVFDVSRVSRRGRAE
jgi:hypothetical protein